MTQTNNKHIYETFFYLFKKIISLKIYYGNFLILNKVKINKLKK